MMRLFETALILTNLLAFVLQIIPLPNAVQWMRYSALIAPLLAGLQIAAEGPRWQMAPAYAFIRFLL